MKVSKDASSSCQSQGNGTAPSHHNLTLHDLTIAPMIRSLSSSARPQVGEEGRTISMRRLEILSVIKEAICIMDEIDLHESMDHSNENIQ